MNKINNSDLNIFYKYKEHQTKLSVRTIRKKFHDIKKKSMMHLIREETSPEPASNTQIIEEEKNWQKIINHTLFLQLNGQKKKKGQEYNDSVSLTDGYSDNKSIQVQSYRNKIKKPKLNKSQIEYIYFKK